jgi:hypothetical protein
MTNGLTYGCRYNSVRGIQMPESEKDTAKSAVEDVSTSIVSFDPLKFLRTLKFVLGDHRRLGNAIASQEWEGLLAPTKYFTACLLVLGIGLFFLIGKETEKSGWSLDQPFIYAFAICVIVPFVWVQYLCLSADARKLDQGALEGMAKVYQCYAFVVGRSLL